MVSLVMRLRAASMPASTFVRAPCHEFVKSQVPSDDGDDGRIGGMSTVVGIMTDEQLAAIAERHCERREFHDHIPCGPYFYDSCGYIHNELGMREAGQPKSKLKKPGILVRSDDWFGPVDMDARMTKTDREVGSDLGQYLALALDHDVERDMAALIAEVNRLRAARGR